MAIDDSSARRRRTKKAGAKKRAGAKKAAAAAASTATPSPASEEFPRRIFANASPRSLGQVSMFEPGVMADATTIGYFASDEAVVERAVNLLVDAGFEVHAANSFLINISGTRRLYETAFGTELILVERDVIKLGEPAEGTFIDSLNSAVDGLIPVEGTRFEEVLDGVAIEEPRYLDAVSILDPTVRFFHLTMPGDVSVGLNAERVHRSGITGKYISVAMVDTGFEVHPFFTDRGYRVDPTVLGPGTSNPTKDEHGHGTGEAANIFATAPDVRLTPVKTATASGALVNTTAAVSAAAALNPHIITNSWGASVPSGPLSAARQAQAAAVAAAVADGITVVFSAGNGGWGFPGQHPDVISVGGVHMRQDATLEASSYTSGFMSNVYPGRRVPDVSGLVGMSPRAGYIMLPVPAGCILDSDLSGGSHPLGDETVSNDGWAAFSGTSAAAPQVAGVCALIKQACSRLTPREIRDILMSTATDVTQGTNAMGATATTGPDTATGNGLVNAHKAVLIAKLRCMRVFPPVLPPFNQPILPVLPPFVQPFRPVLPPFQPVLPPFNQPVLPPFNQPVFPPPFGPRPFEEGAGGAEGLSADDLDALERMVLDDDSFGS
jgi:hypothetical protein